MHSAAMPDSTVAFYDGLAADYHLVYGDRWDEAVARQGAVLEWVIRRTLPGARDVLDCSCGIGTQAIGLARRGFRVHGTDASPRSIERARAERRGSAPTSPSGWTTSGGSTRFPGIATHQPVMTAANPTTSAGP